MGLFLCQPQSSEIVLGFVADSAQATGLKWAAPAGGGKVLQVVNATYTTHTTSSSTTFANTGLTATITPTLATSKVLVMVTQSGIYKSDENTSIGVYINLLRGATALSNDFGGAAGLNDTLKYNYVGSAAINYLDSPATTSATTYKTQFKNNNSQPTVGVQVSGAMSSITLIEIGA